MLTQEEIVNRFGNHEATDETGPIHDEMRQHFMEFARYLSLLIPKGRLGALAFTELEACSMWAHKSVAEKAPLVDPDGWKTPRAPKPVAHFQTGE